MTEENEEDANDPSRLQRRSISLTSDHDRERYVHSFVCDVVARSGRPPLIVTDKDGTLTHPRQSLSPDVASAIADLLSVGVPLAVVSGGELYRLEAEIFDQLSRSVGGAHALENLYFMPENGTQLHRYSPNHSAFREVCRVDLKQRIGQEKFSKILQITAAMMDVFGIEKVEGIRQIVSEGSQIKFSPLGNTKDDALRRKFDPNGDKRTLWVQHLRSRFAEEGLADSDGLIVSVIVAGTASINILPRGMNKGSAIADLASRLAIQERFAIYFGDKFGSSGNDADAIPHVGLAINVGADVALPSLFSVDQKGPMGTAFYLRAIWRALCGASLK